jgi:hypothetical protein
MPVILATQKAEIKRIQVRSQPGQIVREILSQKKNPSQKRAQGVGPEFTTAKKKLFMANYIELNTHTY